MMQLIINNNNKIIGMDMLCTSSANGVENIIGTINFEFCSKYFFINCFFIVFGGLTLFDCGRNFCCMVDNFIISGTIWSFIHQQYISYLRIYLFLEQTQCLCNEVITYANIFPESHIMHQRVHNGKN